MRVTPLKLTLLAAALLPACGDSGGSTSPTPHPTLPPETLLHAQAFQAYPDGSTVTCSFTAFLTWSGASEPSAGERVFTGSMGGEAMRQVLDATGAGVAFFADMAWPTTQARVIGVDSVEFILGPGDPTSRFWDAFSGLAGRKEATGTWTGPWICYPLDLNSGGWVDTSLSAAGHWVITDQFVQRP
jgi:hypothetical protein